MGQKNKVIKKEKSKIKESFNCEGNIKSIRKIDLQTLQLWIQYLRKHVESDKVQNFI